MSRRWWIVIAAVLIVVIIIAGIDLLGRHWDNQIADKHPPAGSTTTWKASIGLMDDVCLVTWPNSTNHGAPDEIVGGITQVDCLAKKGFT